MDQQMGFYRADQQSGITFDPCAPMPEPINVALVLLQDFSMASYACALEAFASEAKRHTGIDIKIITIGVTGYEVNSDLGVQVIADKILHELQTDQNFIMVIGGQNLQTVENPWLTQKLKMAGYSGALLAGVWSGTWSLSQAKLLDGYRCACPTPMQSALSWTFADVRASSQSFVMDRNRFTAFGPEGTTALVNKFLEKIHKSRTMKDKLKNFLTTDDEYYEALLIKTFGAPKRLPKYLLSTLKLMCENLTDPVDISELATLANVSRRQLERRFMKFLDITPNRAYLELRLTRAKQLIGETEQTLKEIGLKTGFLSPPHFLRCFKDLYGIPPSLYRKNLDQD